MLNQLDIYASAIFFLTLNLSNIKIKFFKVSTRATPPNTPSILNYRKACLDKIFPYKICLFLRLFASRKFSQAVVQAGK